MKNVSISVRYNRRPGPVFCKTFAPDPRSLFESLSPSSIKITVDGRRPAEDSWLKKCEIGEEWSLADFMASFFRVDRFSFDRWTKSLIKALLRDYNDRQFAISFDGPKGDYEVLKEVFAAAEQSGRLTAKVSRRDCRGLLDIIFNGRYFPERQYGRTGNGG